MYERQKKSVQDFVPIGSAEEEELIKKMNEKETDEDTSNKEEVLKEPKSTKIEVKQEGREENIKKRLGRRLKMKSTKKSKRQKTDSDLEEEEQLRASLKIVHDEEEEIDYEVLGIDLVLWGDLRIMFEETTDDDIWKNQEKWIIKKRRYPLIKETLERMMELRLTAESEADSLLKTIWFSTHHASHAPCYNNEALAIIEQTATGKEISNPFMAGSLPKTTQPTSTDTLRLLTNEQKAFRDNLHKSGVGYNGSCVFSQAYAKIPKLYRASEICDKNEQLHVFDSEKTLEDAEKSQLKMNEFQKDEKVQELKIQPIDYEKLNKLYKDFVP
ncbi:hypothetical protein Tco_1290992 [Tanacetum coccineum]